LFFGYDKVNFDFWPGKQVNKGTSADMKERGRHILEFAAIVAGISGLSLSQLQRTHPYIFYTGYIVLVILCFVVFLSRKEINRFTKKKIINSIWQDLLAGSQQSIQVFAGDVSWIDRDEGIIRDRVENGVDVSVLCRPPKANDLLKKNISRLIEAGGKVRYYDPKDTPVLRGLVIDGEEKNVNTALTVQKSPRKDIKRRYGVPGSADIYDYRGKRYVPPQDEEYIETLHRLFRCISGKALLGVVMQPREMNIDEIAGLLSVVPHYSGIKPAKIKRERVHIHKLWSPCLYVKEYKFANTLALLDAYETQGFHCFEPCTALSHEKKCLLLPPVLERDDDRLVVIDGVHRLYCRYLYRQKAEAECLIIENEAPLPGEPIPFMEMKVAPRKIPREHNFEGFRPDFFRNIDLLDNALVQFAKN
jgi:hypothetical protein